jgi:hypothetical protein
MPFSLKDTLLDAIGFGPEISDPSPSRHRKRRTSEDGRRLSKARRHRDEVYRSTPYGTYYSSPAARAQDSPTNKNTWHLPRRASTSEINTRVSEVDDDGDSVLSSDYQLPAGFVSEDPLHSSPPKHDSAHQVPSTMSPQTRHIRMPSLSPIQNPVSKFVTQKPIAPSPVPKLVPPKELLAKKILSPKKKSATKQDDPPNRLARDIIARGIRNPAKTIQHEFHEPEYAFRDVEIRDGMWALQDMLEDFGNDFFAFITTPAALSDSFFTRFEPETAKVIGCVASGGPGGVRGWHTLFLNVHPRRALVMAIIGNVLVEQVFQHMFFGGIVKHVREVTELQEKHQDEDGGWFLSAFDYCSDVGY